MQRFCTVVVLAFLAVPALAARQTLQQIPPAASQRPADDGDPNKPPAAAIVRGHVFGADTGQPLRKAQVRLFSTDVPSGGTTENRQATTDASGSYEFKDLPAGKYLVSANKGGYVGMSIGQVRPNEPGKAITLRATELRERLDFTLLRGGVITGRVVDEYGEPISRIQIGAMRSETIGGRKQLMPSGRMATTDDLGEFRLFGISPGQYYVQATWHGMTPVLAPGAPADDETGYATTFFPGTSAATEAQRLTVVSGQTISDVAFAMVPAKTARISGTVVDSHGGRAQGMLMISRQESGTIGSGINMSVPIRPDGTFTFANVSPGDYTLRAMLTGSKRETAVVNVSVAGVDITDVALTTVPPSSATGRIVADPSASQSLASATLSVMAIPLEPSGFDPGRVPGARCGRSDVQIGRTGRADADRSHGAAVRLRRPRRASRRRRRHRQRSRVQVRARRHGTGDRAHGQADRGKRPGIGFARRQREGLLSRRLSTGPEPMGDALALSEGCAARRGRPVQDPPDCRSASTTRSHSIASTTWRGTMPNSCGPFSRRRRCSR